MEWNQKLKFVFLFTALLGLLLFGREILTEVSSLREFLLASPVYYGFLLWGVYLVFTLVGLPVSPITVLAGSVYGFWFGVFLMVGALFPSLVVATWMTRYFFREPIRAFLLSQKKMQSSLHLMDHGSDKIHFLLRISGWTPFALLTYLMALSNKSMGRLVVVAVLGTIPHKALQVYLGNVGGKFLTGQGLDWTSVGFLGLAVVSVVGIVWFTRKELQVLQKGKEKA